ncbi:MAG: TPM domain-containing protein [Candidatus Saccharimonas sp.]
MGRYGRLAVFALIIASLMACISSSAGALAVPPAPSLDRPVVDTTDTLTDSEITQLSQQITQGRQEKSYQMAVLLVQTLGANEYLEGYSLKVARAWGIGDKTNNGVLLLVVKNDRLMRIEVGTGLEGDLTDTRANNIITNVIRPKFRVGNYYGGISEGVASMQLAITRQADPKLLSQSDDSMSMSDLFWIGVFFLFIIAGVCNWIASMLARSKSWWGGGILGGSIGAGIMAYTAWHPLAVVLTTILVPLGLLFDFLVSRNYHDSMARGKRPAWWAGGSAVDTGRHKGDYSPRGGWWWGGGFGGGGGGGGFGGGGFGGGGASGDW